MRLGSSSPKRARLFSSYSLYEPSKKNTCESPSNANICVQIRSKNQRSWLITTAQPAKFSRPSSNARNVFTSMSFVGSSRSSTLASDFRFNARCKRFLSPPDKTEADFDLEKDFNIVIGGNVIGRGLTIPKLQTVYYSRTAKRPNADTFWQHSRICGYLS